MKVFKWSEMTKGWFVGNFSPVALKTSAAEVAVKEYKAGAYEAKHHHKVASEVTMIQSGEVEMNGQIYRSGDILVIEPGYSTDFRALTDAVTVVVKVPGVPDDKYVD